MSKDEKIGQVSYAKALSNTRLMHLLFLLHMRTSYVHPWKYPPYFGGLLRHSYEAMTLKWQYFSTHSTLIWGTSAGANPLQVPVCSNWECSAELFPWNREGVLSADVIGMAVCHIASMWCDSLLRSTQVTFLSVSSHYLFAPFPLLVVILTFHCYILGCHEWWPDDLHRSCCLCCPVMLCII